MRKIAVILAAALSLVGCRHFENAAEPRISVFAGTLERLAKDRDISLNAAADLLIAAGVTGFETDYTNKRLPELARSGLEVVNLYGFPNLLGPDGGDKDIEAFVATAVQYAVPRIMVVPNSFKEGADQESDYLRLREALKKLVARAQARGVVVTIENFGGTSNPCSYTRYIKRFLDDIPGLDFTLDSGNLYYAGRGEDILDLLHFTEGRIRHLHLKDQERENNRKYTTLGKGAVPNEAIVRHMRRRGYKDWHTLENLMGDDILGDVRQQVGMVRAWRK